LGRVSVAESLHEEWHGVVSDLILGHHEERRLAEASDSECARGAEDFSKIVIPVDAASAEIDDANTTAGVAVLGSVGLLERAPYERQNRK
jgi:hypothetical protein